MPMSACILPHTRISVTMQLYQYATRPNSKLPDPMIHHRPSSTHKIK
jgi:hypothetical protein